MPLQAIEMIQSIGGSNPSLSANYSIKTESCRLSKTLDTVSVEPWEQQQH
jgi:hypothetical protein